MNVNDVFQVRSSDRQPGPALILADRTLSYHELDQRVAALAGHLIQQGVVAGQVVAMRLLAPLTQVLAMLAVARIGATNFSLSLNIPIKREREWIRRVEARWLITDLPRSDRSELPVILLAEPDAAWQSPAQNPPEPVSDPEAPWTILVGSGSTGKPKFLPIGHRQILERMQRAPHWLPYGQQDRILSLIGLDFHSSKQRLLEAFAIGAAVVLPEPSSLLKLSQLLDGPATVVYGTVFHYEIILNALTPERTGCWHGLTALWITGSTVTDELRRRLRDRLCRSVYVTYGANECSTCSCVGPPEVFDVPRSVGYLVPGFELEVVDDQERPLPAGQHGQVRIRSATTISGYHDDGKATAAAFRQGWFYPGDRAMLRSDGLLIHAGRTDAMMLINGINIDPVEVEVCLQSHPAVAEAVVMPLRHPVHQDVSVAAVVLVDQAITREEELLAFVQGHLGRLYLSSVVIMEQLPRNPMGKLQRQELRTLLQRQLQPSPVAEPSSSADGSFQCFQALLQAPLPAFRVLAELQWPVAAELGRIDQWLLGPLAFEQEPQWFGRPLAPEQDREAALAWIDRALLLATSLLQIAQIPILAKPDLRLLVSPPSPESSSEPTSWRVAVDFSLIEELSPQIYRQALNQGLGILTWMANHPITPEHQSSLFSHLNQVAETQFKHVLPPGKSRVPVLKAAHQRDIPLLSLGRGIFQLGWGAKAKRMDRSSTEADSHMSVQLSHNKLVTARLLARAGYPHAFHGLAANLEEARTQAGRIGWPVVVKPVDADRGEGVAVAIADDDALAQAYAVARSHSRLGQVLVERQVPGVCHRLFIVAGTLLYAVKRLPIGVYGDGRLTVGDLVRQSRERADQRPPWQRDPIPQLDDLAEASLQAAGLNLKSIPALRSFVPLRPIETTAWGGVDEDVSETIHPENLRIAIGAARLFGLSMAGIDLISLDLAIPWYQNGAVINEVNFAPVLGDGSISRSRIPVFLQSFIDGAGRIPVHVFVGGAAALKAARAQQVCLHAAGVAAVLTTAAITWATPDQLLPMAIEGLFGRSRALLLSPRVEFLLLVVQSDELFHRGLPLDRVDLCHFVDDELVDCQAPNSPAPPHQLAMLKTWLQGWALSSP